jgi:hypothetical protein
MQCPNSNQSKNKLGTDSCCSGFETTVIHLEHQAWVTSIGMVDCTDWTAGALKENHVEPPGFSAWFNARIRLGEEEDPLEHMPAHQCLVILAAMAWTRKGHSEQDLNHQELLDKLSDLSYPGIVEHCHKTRLKWEGQQRLLNGKGNPVMRVPCPTLVQEREMNPATIPKELSEDPEVKDPHLLVAFFEHVASSESMLVPVVNKKLWASLCSSEIKALWIYDLQMKVCIQDSLHGFPEPPTWPQSREGGEE